MMQYRVGNNLSGFGQQRVYDPEGWSIGYDQLGRDQLTADERKEVSPHKGNALHPCNIINIEPRLLEHWMKLPEEVKAKYRCLMSFPQSAMNTVVTGYRRNCWAKSQAEKRRRQEEAQKLQKDFEETVMHGEIERRSMGADTSSLVLPNKPAESAGKVYITRETILMSNQPNVERQYMNDPFKKSLKSTIPPHPLASLNQAYEQKQTKDSLNEDSWGENIMAKNWKGRHHEELEWGAGTKLSPLEAEAWGAVKAAEAEAWGTQKEEAVKKAATQSFHPLQKIENDEFKVVMEKFRKWVELDLLKMKERQEFWDQKEIEWKAKEEAKRAKEAQKAQKKAEKKQVIEIITEKGEIKKLEIGVPAAQKMEAKAGVKQPIENSQNLKQANIQNINIAQEKKALIEKAAASVPLVEASQHEAITTLKKDIDVVMPEAKSALMTSKACINVPLQKTTPEAKPLGTTLMMLPQVR